MRNRRVTPTMTVNRKLCHPKMRWRGVVVSTYRWCVRAYGGMVWWLSHGEVHVREKMVLQARR